MTKRTNKLPLPYLKQFFVFIMIFFFSVKRGLLNHPLLMLNGFEHIALHRTQKKKTAKRGLIVYHRNMISKGIEIYQCHVLVNMMNNKTQYLKYTFNYNKKY